MMMVVVVGINRHGAVGAKGVGGTFKEEVKGNSDDRNKLARSLDTAINGSKGPKSRIG